MFITLEGPEGSGKTTAVEAAVKKLDILIVILSFYLQN